MDFSLPITVEMRRLLLTGIAFFVLLPTLLFPQHLDFATGDVNATAGFYDMASGKVFFNFSYGWDGVRNGPFCEYRLTEKKDTILLLRGTFSKGNLVDTAWWYDPYKGTLVRKAVFTTSHGWHDLPWKDYTRLNLSGIADGPCKTWYANGATASEGVYRNGLREGLFREFDEYGNPVAEKNYLHDALDGKCRTWYRNGRLKEEGDYAGNRKAGKWFYYDMNGMPSRSDFYHNGLLSDTTFIYYPSGIVKETTLMKNGVKCGDHREYDSTGHIAVYAHYDDAGLRDSVEIVYYPSGKKAISTHLKLDYRHGLYESWYENGQMDSTGRFDWNLQDGKWKYYDRSGKLLRVRNFKYDVFIEDAPLTDYASSIENSDDGNYAVFPLQNPFPVIEGFSSHVEIPPDQKMKFLLKYDYVDVIASMDTWGNVKYTLVTRMKPKEAAVFLDYLGHHFNVGKPLYLGSNPATCTMPVRITVSR